MNELPAAGDSSEQRGAELELLTMYGARAGLHFVKKRVPLPDGNYLELDGAIDVPLTICEVWAHVGRPKGGQSKKVMTDALKLLYAERILGGRARKLLLFGDEGAAACFKTGSWMAHALKDFGVEVVVEPLSELSRSRVLLAQRRQTR